MLLGFNKKFWSFIIIIVIVGIVFTMNPGHTRQQDAVQASVPDTISIDHVDDCGILPNSPFYFTKDWSRTLRLFFAFRSPKKAELALRFANEDALAIKELCQKEEYILTGKQCGSFQEQLQETLKWVVKMRQEGKDTEGLMTKLKQDHLNQQLILASVLEKVPEWAKEGILGAIENSSSLLGHAIEEIQGNQQMYRFREDLSIQFGDVDSETQFRIRERLGMVSQNPEEATGSVGIPTSVNHPPAITSLVTDDEWLTPTDKCHIMCQAEDPDGDSLNYEWSASGGQISGSGPSVTWIPPEKEDNYDVMVIVSDGCGGEDTASLTINVEFPPPPVIESLIVTPETPKYFVEQLIGYTILKNKRCEIECVVSGGDMLSYEWSASKGEITGEGSTITWTAPSRKCDVVLTVLVSDRYGNVVSGEIYFHVSDCAWCFL